MIRTFIREAGFVLLVTVTVLLLVVTMSCGYDSNGPYGSPTPSAVEGLWTSSGSNPAILRLDPSQLLATGAITPATAISTSSAALFDLDGIAFDANGTLWVTSQDDSMLVGFAPTSLSRSGSTAATIVISRTNSSLSAPTALAFDRQHRLWVANSENGTLVRFDPAQLAASGSPVPAVTISGLGRPAGLAFDAAGSLWVSDSRRAKLASFSEAQLDTSGLLIPRVVISALAASMATPSGIAFDADGNLWVGNIGNQTVVGFSPAQLAATGTPAPHVVLSANAGSLSIPTGLAFDTEGSLWVMGGTGALEKFPKASLGATGAPAPNVRLTFSSYNLFWSVAFWPKPIGLPLN
jgi:sugar lactone lactonase YvrE